jgi:predicted site-specific integrase-resolvase
MVKQVKPEQEANNRLDLNQIIELIPVSAMTIMNWVNAGVFPLPRENEGRALWDKNDLVKWARTRPPRLRKYAVNL